MSEGIQQAVGGMVGQVVGMALPGPGPQGREGMAKALREVEGRCLKFQGMTKRLEKFVRQAREGGFLPAHMEDEAESLESQARGLLQYYGGNAKQGEAS